MDARLQLLLRRYTATGDPNDAVAYVNELRRSTGSLGSKVHVWVSRIYYPEEDEIRLFSSKKKALKHACQMASRIVDGVYDEDSEDTNWALDFDEAIRLGRYSSALSIYNTWWDLVIEVYEEQVS